MQSPLPKAFCITSLLVPKTVPQKVRLWKGFMMRAIPCNIALCSMSGVSPGTMRSNSSFLLPASLTQYQMTCMKVAWAIPQCGHLSSLVYPVWLVITLSQVAPCWIKRRMPLSSLGSLFNEVFVARWSISYNCSLSFRFPLVLVRAAVAMGKARL